MQNQTETQTQAHADQQEEKLWYIVKVVMEHQHDKNLNYLNTKVKIIGRACVEVVEDAECSYYYDDPYDDPCGDVCFTSVKETVVKIDSDDFTQLDDIVKMCNDVLADARSKREKFIKNRRKLVNELKKLGVKIEEEPR